jgi:predicted DCC family thiol-disulfide oxidoreductase YuxK
VSAPPPREALGADATGASALTVYYDGACPLCRREIGYYRHQRGAERIDWIDVSSDGADAIAPDLDRAAALTRFHVRLPDGRLADGARGFAAMWGALPGWRWLGLLVGAPVVALVMEAGYRWFLRIRPAMQRLAAALEPDTRSPRHADSSASSVPTTPRGGSEP